MMKKFLTVLVLGLVVFAVSCSTDEDKFLDAVKGKTAVASDNTEFSFSSDGRTVDVGGNMTFQDAESSTVATYTASGCETKFTLSGNGGSLVLKTTSGGEAGESANGSFTWK